MYSLSLSIYIYIYICPRVLLTRDVLVARARARGDARAYSRGNHLSSTTCPTQVFFASGE